MVTTENGEMRSGFFCCLFYSITKLLCSLELSEKLLCFGFLILMMVFQQDRATVFLEQNESMRNSTLNSRCVSIALIYSYHFSLGLELSQSSVEFKYFFFQT